MFDKLQEMLRLQKVLDDRLGFTERDVQTKINDNFMSALHEWCELHDKSHWKRWKKSFKEPSHDEVLEEFADLIHFILQYALIKGYSADDIYNMYVYKNEINHKRIENNY